MPASRKSGLHDRLVHADRRGEHAGADVGQVGQLEQPLDGAVLAVRAVQDREDDVERRVRGAPPREREECAVGWGRRAMVTSTPCSATGDEVALRRLEERGGSPGRSASGPSLVIAIGTTS